MFLLLSYERVTFSTISLGSACRSQAFIMLHTENTATESTVLCSVLCMQRAFEKAYAFVWITQTEAEMPRGWISSNLKCFQLLDLHTVQFYRNCLHYAKSMHREFVVLMTC